MTTAAKLFTAAVNASFAAINYLATGSTGFESSWERWWREACDKFSPAMHDIAMWLIRSDLPLPIHTSLEPLKGDLETTYRRIVAKERGDHIVP